MLPYFSFKYEEFAIIETNINKSLDIIIYNSFLAWDDPMFHNTILALRPYGDKTPHFEMTWHSTLIYTSSILSETRIYYTNNFVVYSALV